MYVCRHICIYIKVEEELEDLSRKKKNQPCQSSTRFFHQSEYKDRNEAQSVCRLVMAQVSSLEGKKLIYLQGLRMRTSSLNF